MKLYSFSLKSPWGYAVESTETIREETHASREGLGEGVGLRPSKVESYTWPDVGVDLQERSWEEARRVVGPVVEEVTERV